MKTFYLSLSSLLFAGILFAQEPDTTRMNFGKMQVIVVEAPDGEDEPDSGDTIDASPDEEELEEIEAHWAGLEFGPTILLNSSMKSSFPDYPQWENDPGRSFSWNLNFLEHKFRIYQNYVGITTGLGFNWTQIGLKQYVLNTDNDTLVALTDTINDYNRNTLRAIYLTAPLMLEICSSNEDDGKFYLAAGVIGGVRIGSSVKTKTDDNKQKTKGTYGLEAFRLDAAVKLGYKDWGVFANYNLLPMFDTDKTAAVYPLTFGLTLNF